MGLIRQLVKSAMTACLPADRWLVRGRALPRGPLPAISLTFDDGPHPEHTPRVLDALRHWNLTATFFVIGRQAAAYPQLIAHMVREGHSVANHTWSHSEPSHTPSKKFAEEVDQTSLLLEALTGAAPRFVRPPKGELSLAKTIGLLCENYTVALWNVDPRDYRLETVEAARSASAQTNWQHGDVVLLHDNRPGAAWLLNAWGEAGRWSECQTVPLTTWLPQPQTMSVAQGTAASLTPAAPTLRT